MIFKTGDSVILNYDGRTVSATVRLASPNGRSLMIAWDGDVMLGGHAGMMPVFRQENGRYYSLIEGGEVLLISVVDNAQADEADYVVCCRAGIPSPFKDNATGVCSHCGHAIFFRPHVPTKPAKICIECMAEMGTATRQ